MKNLAKLLILVLSLFFFSSYNFSNAIVEGNFPATTSYLIDYAKNQALSIIDTSFRGSWVISTENWNMLKEASNKIRGPFVSLAKVKIGSNQTSVRNTLKSPQERRNNGKIWIYGTPSKDGSYQDLLEVFFDEKLEYVTGIISFDPKNIEENIGVTIGDPIDKVIDLYGEVENEKDFVEDLDNKQYLGLYYLYPKSGIGFLFGQEGKTDDPVVKGILVFAKN